MYKRVENCLQEKQKMLVTCTLSFSTVFSKAFFLIVPGNSNSGLCSKGLRSDLCNGKQLFPPYFPAKFAIIRNEYYCTTFTDSFFPFFPFLNYYS